MIRKIIIFSALAVLLTACGSKPAKKTAESLAPAAFSADSAYSYIAAQVALGARVPGSLAHEQCARYLRSQLQTFGAEVSVEQGQMTCYNGQPQQVYNIIGRFNTEAKKRILLCAHWDCRPWSDQEETQEARMQPVLGANDGASGVGILLEIARQLHDSLLPAPLGVDIVFFDAEDMGTPSFYTGKELEDTWCLGSQLWAKNYRSTPSDKRYIYGILLDMVASPGAVFHKEYFSTEYASAYVDKIWHVAERLGYSGTFVNTPSYPVTDDHYYINTIAGFPCLDIIHYDRQSGTGFPEYWHTNHDDMSNVSRQTIDAVGKTVLTTILN